MGLDMFMYGVTKGRKPEELGYWRKHPDLHGFIVQTFAGGLDECQEIPLDLEALERIAQAVRDRGLPHTEGFFFGTSDGSEETETLEILAKVIVYLDPRCEAHDDCLETAAIGRACYRAAHPRESRRVVYQASW
jgi:hypothetical protein